MNQLKTSLLALVAAFTIIACKNEQRKINKEPIENNESSSIENPLQEDQNNEFQKTLTFQNISFDISTNGEGSIRELAIESKGLKTGDQKLVSELDGQAVDAEIGDLNSDGYPEILIYTMSAGSGSYGNVIGYSVNNGKSLSQIYFPEISENKDASRGYMGHDEFAIVETTLVRKFPVYKDTDTNNNPTGGTRQIEYKLKDGEASRIFVINKISEF